jgi:hypothetical protein
MANRNELRPSDTLLQPKNDPRNHTKRHEKSPWFESFRVLSWIAGF